MSPFSMDNPVFVSYVIAACLMVLKILGQGWVTVYRMMSSNSGLINPEDLKPGPANRNPAPDQLELNDYVDRSRRVQRNDLENIPAFLACGLIFVAVGPPLVLANIFFVVFVLARLAHTWAYMTSQRHETRATFYTIGSVITIIMALYALAAAVF